MGRHTRHGAEHRRDRRRPAGRLGNPLHDQGGSPYVVEQILDGCAGTGAKARIVAVHGSPQAKKDLMITLKAYANEQPQCAAELHRFAHEP